MKDLIERSNNENWADSHLIARKFGYRHRNLTDVIDSIIDDLSKLGGNKLPPKNSLGDPKYMTEDRSYRGNEYTAYLMNRPFFSLLAGRLRGKKVFEWQIKFNTAFYEMESALLLSSTNQDDTLWLDSRATGKIARREETDVIKDFVDYATSQGSQNAEFYYRHITNASYKAMGLIAKRHPGIRDTMGMYELAELMLIERFARAKLDEYMKLGRNYKDIYNCVRDDMIEYGKSICFKSVQVKT